MGETWTATVEVEDNGVNLDSLVDTKDSIIFDFKNINCTLPSTKNLVYASNSWTVMKP